MDEILTLFLGVIVGLLSAVLFSIGAKWLSSHKNILIKVGTAELSIDPSKPDAVQRILGTFSSPRIFIGYAHDDKEIANKLAIDLKEQGIRVWIDDEQIRAGDNWKAKIKEGLNTSGYFLALISKSSLKSELFRKELTAAMNREVQKKWPKIIPVLVEESDLPPSMAERRYVDLKAGYVEAVNEIINAVMINRDIA